MRRLLTEVTPGDVADGSRTHIASAVPCYALRRMIMKYAILSLLVTASTLTTIAVAQDGTGHGPPQSIIIMPQPIPVPTTTSPTVPVPRLWQFKLPLAPMTK
jgi:hypothetical protein